MVLRMNLNRLLIWEFWTCFACLKSTCLLLNYRYRKKCIYVDDDYIEARRAEEKFKKTLTKASIKQKEQIRNFQDKELLSIEETQKQQFTEFSQAWDEYM